MKDYVKPVIKTGRIYERTALNCGDYSFYIKDYEGCMDEFMGKGKTPDSCDSMHS